MDMALDPQAKALLDGMAANKDAPRIIDLPPAGARELYRAMAAQLDLSGLPIGKIEDRKIAGPAGEIPVRLYTPVAAGGAPLPVLVYFHGGGWVIGDLDSHDAACRTLAHEAGALVIAVDYRLSPEHKFPAAVEDAIAATDWIADNATSLGIDPARLMVCGDSAGGNLAAVVALNAREHGPKIAGQVLIYPATDFRMAHPSHSEPETSCLLTHSVIRWFRDQYLPTPAHGDDWRASPARAGDLAGLPPAYVLTAGADPLRDEGDEYAARLRNAGVAVKHITHPGQFHGFITMGKLLPKAGVALADIGAWLKALD